MRKKRNILAFLLVFSLILGGCGAADKKNAALDGTLPGSGQGKEMERTARGRQPMNSRR